jgi:hypothetical protein
LALSIISLLRSGSVAFRCEADMRTVDRSNQSDVNDPQETLVGLKSCSAAISLWGRCVLSFDRKHRVAALWQIFDAMPALIRGRTA